MAIIPTSLPHHGCTAWIYPLKTYTYKYVGDLPFRHFIVFSCFPFSQLFLHKTRGTTENTGKLMETSADQTCDSMEYKKKKGPLFSLVFLGIFSKPIHVICCNWHLSFLSFQLGCYISSHLNSTSCQWDTLLFKIISRLLQVCKSTRLSPCQL